MKISFVIYDVFICMFESVRDQVRVNNMFRELLYK